MNPYPTMVSVFPPSSESRGGVCMTRNGVDLLGLVGKAIGVGDTPAQRQHQTHGMLGHGRRVGPTALITSTPELGGRLDVDLVGAGRTDEDHLELHRPGPACPPSPGDAHRAPWRGGRGPRAGSGPGRPGHRLVPLDEPIGAAETDGPLRLVEAVDHLDVVGPCKQGVGVGMEQEGGDQDLLRARSRALAGRSTSSLSSLRIGGVRSRCRPVGSPTSAPE